jgi:polar amino acid transport system substrate-binding protein
MATAGGRADTIGRMTRILALLGSVVVLAVALTACGSDDDSGSSSSSGSSGSSSSTTSSDEASCKKDTLALFKTGQLTVGTDKPAYPPYFEDDDPTNGKGFESAVAYAVAKQLGFSQSEVKWTVVPFNSSYAPGPKKFDFDINQISITPARQKRVDFSKPYFTAPQAVVALKASDAASATSLADLAKAKLGVQVGTTSLDAVADDIKPSSQPQVFNDSNDTVRALKNDRVDAIVVDLPTALYLTAAEIPKAKIVGQFSAPGGDEWGLLLKKDSELTPCVDKAVQALDADGTLSRLQDQYLGSDAAPKLN